MKGFLVRALSLCAIVGMLMVYNSVLTVRAEEEETARLEAEAAQQAAAEAAGETEEAEEGAYTDGTYTGEAQGFGGLITVEVVVTDGAISEINILSAEQEDGAYLEMAEDIIPAMIEAQTWEADTISGATFSSTGIRDAVELALEDAAR